MIQTTSHNLKAPGVPPDPITALNFVSRYLRRIDIDHRSELKGKLATLPHSWALFETGNGHHIVILADLTDEEFRRYYREFQGDPLYEQVTKGLVHRFSPKFRGTTVVSPAPTLLEEHLKATLPQTIAAEWQLLHQLHDMAKYKTLEETLTALQAGNHPAPKPALLRGLWWLALLFLIFLTWYVLTLSHGLA